MKKRLHEAIQNASEIKALLVLTVVLFLRAWRAIPSLRPIHLLIPATAVQVILLAIVVLFSSHIIAAFAIGNFIVVGIFLFPLLQQPPKYKAHWVKSE